MLSFCNPGSYSDFLSFTYTVCESWTIKKAECQKIGALALWCWRLLRAPWTVRRSNKSILKEISPGCSLRGLMLKLKLQYFGHLMWRTNSLEKTLMLRKNEGRRRGWQRKERWHYRLHGHEFEQALGDDESSQWVWKIIYSKFRLLPLVT